VISAVEEALAFMMDLMGAGEASELPNARKSPAKESKA
jgi:hypothetical protein